MSVAPKRGIKRKRGTDEPVKNDSQPYKRPIIAPEVKFRTKLHHGIKEVKKASKIAKTREIQKLVKRIKELREKHGQTQDVLVIEKQLQGLKNLDHESIATEMLARRLQKDRHIQSNEQVKLLVSQELKVEPITKHRDLIENRINSSKILAASVGDLVTSLRELILPPRAADPETVNPVDIMEVGPDEEQDDGWESGSVSDHDHIHQANHDDPKITKVPSISKPPAKALTSSEEEDDDDEGDDNDLIHTKKSRDKLVSQAKTLQDSSSDVEESTFLPSLAVGFTRGDSSASDWSGDEGNVSNKVDLAPRKNRRGQRARKAIWEKKYGKNANHLKKQREDEAAEKKKRIEKALSRVKLQQGKGRHTQNNVPFKDRPKDSGWGKKATVHSTATTEPSLHPSWDAAKKRKAMPMIVPSEGKKITF
ncbi:hypothetical protein M408DRAFT_25945 [Serendipita vermifera MAFF 305830]|uniref:Bud22 domain-containing protein n=1 Tax=Serendipita vermifera MAFF 305830 TaxID=933852 RepID=A0A0C2X9D2_SERVB|nr:hypothetical protein M408DRAFT_25945 [Serendipita vermifera MAFF 305830]